MLGDELSVLLRPGLFVAVCSASFVLASLNSSKLQGLRWPDYADVFVVQALFIFTDTDNEKRCNASDGYDSVQVT